MALFYKPFRFIGIALCAVFLLGLTAGLNSSFAATSLFVVEGIEVDITADNALEAKRQAFAQAQRDAFDTLLQRMLTDEERLALQNTEATTVSSLIKDYEITQEKLSRVRYIGTYTIRFREKAVQKYFTDLGFGFSDVRGKPIMVLPLYREDGDTVLWAEKNEWLKAWNRTEQMQGLVPVTVPIGDLDDVRDIGDDNALTYSKDTMARLLKRYGADETVIAIAVPDGENLTIQIYRTDLDTPEFVQEIRANASDVPQPAEEDDNADTIQALNVYDLAVQNVYKFLQRNWKSKTRVSSTGEARQIRAHVPIKTLKEWKETEDAIKDVSAIDDLVVESLSLKGASVALTFKGNNERLQQAFQQRGMTLQARGGGYYSLYLNKYAPAVAPVPIAEPAVPSLSDDMIVESAPASDTPVEEQPEFSSDLEKSKSKPFLERFWP